MFEEKSHNNEQSSALTKVVEQEKVDLNLEGELNISDYVQDVPSTRKTVCDIDAWAKKQQEQTRTCLASRLSTMFGFSLLITILLVGVAAFSPKADKTFIKDVIPLVITPQVTLLGVALTFYFTSKEK